MKFVFSTPNEGAPKDLVANANLEFDSSEGFLNGTALNGFSVWKSSKETLYVTLPSRRAGAGFYDLLRSVERGAVDPVNRVKAQVLADYARHLAAVRAAQEAASLEAATVAA